MLKILTISEVLKEFEIEQVLEIEQECLLSRWSRTGYQEEREREDSVFIIAKIDQTVTGFLAARLISSETEINNKLKFSEIDLLNFGVHPKYQKKGIGKAIFNRLLEMASQLRVDSVWLEVRERNTRAVDFYKKSGFITIQIRKHFYLNPLDNAFVMKLQISTDKTND